MTTAAKRGDLVVIESTHTDFVIGSGSSKRQTFEIGIVTSIDRQGIVQRIKDAWGSPRRLYSWERVYIASKTSVHAEQAHEAAQTQHTYPGHPGQPMPFASLDEAKAFLTPYRIVQAIAA